MKTLASELEFVENEFQDARKTVVTDAVATVAQRKSSFLEFEGGTKQFQKVVKDAHGKAIPCCSTRRAHCDHAAKTTLHLRRAT